MAGTDWIPGVSDLEASLHVRGVVHHAVGDAEGGNQALNAATRTTVVVASGAAAGLATGGIDAIPAVPVPGSSTVTNQNDIPTETTNDATGTRNDLDTVSNSEPQHVDNRDFEKEQEEDLGNISDEYEDAIYYDSYVRDSYNFLIETETSRQEKLDVLNKRRSEEPKEELPETNSPYLSDEDVKKLLSFKNANKDPTNGSEEELENY